MQIDRTGETAEMRAALVFRMEDRLVVPIQTVEPLQVDLLIGWFMADRTRA
jgi:hypothetical protein